MAMNVSEYWIISAPGDKTCQQTWDRMNAATMKQQLSSNWKFHIPDLKVGTLDQLVGLSDDLGKMLNVWQCVLCAECHGFKFLNRGAKM